MRGVMRIPELTLSEVHAKKKPAAVKEEQNFVGFNTSFYFLILQQKIMNGQIENLPKVQNE